MRQAVIVRLFIIIMATLSIILYQHEISKIWRSMTDTLKCKELYNIRASNASRTNNAAQFDLINPLCLKNKGSLPPLYIITPTYRRPEQLADLTRLSHTLMLVPNVHWLVVEDSNKKTVRIEELLQKTGLKYAHLIAPMPEKYKMKARARPRGVSNRNRGLSWLRSNATDGVLYFADDDNTYDLEIFCEMRFTKRVSMWPVGLVTKLGVSSPVIKNGVFSGYYDGWIGGRKYPVDMAGFAVSVKFLLERPSAVMPYVAGYEEDGFLKSLEPFENIEFLASNCSKILVWHTQTKSNAPSLPLDLKKYNNTNIALLKKILI